MVSEEKPGRDRHLIALLAICVSLLLVLAPQLVVPNLIIDYPHLGGDSQDWIANGLHLVGYDVRYSVRPPLLPMAIGLAERLLLLELLPVGLLLLSLSGPVLLYLWLRDRHPRSLALAVALSMLLNYSWLGLGIELMADVPAACLLFAGAFFFARGLEGGRRWYPVAGGLLGLSAVTQQLALLFVVPASAVLLLHRRDHLRSPRLWAGAMLFALPYALWTAHKLWSFGTAGDVVLRNWSLLSVHVGAVGSYLLSAASLLGIPGAVLSVAGGVLLLADGRRRPAELLVALLLAVIVIFFAVLYGHQSKRLLAYIVPLCAVAMAAALARVPIRSLRWGLIGILLATSMMPLPVPPSHYRWAALWPLPPLYLRSLGWAEARAAGVDPGTIRLARLSPAEVAAASIPARAARARRGIAAGSRLGHQAFAGDDSVVWLHDGEVTARHRYQSGLRLGNVLRKRVRHLTVDDLGPLLAAIEAEAVADFEELAIHRGRPIGVDGDWLLVTESGGSAALRQAAAGNRQVEQSSVAADEAARIAELVGKRPVVVIAGPSEPDPSFAYLPFLLSSPEFFVLSRQQYERTAESFGAGPPTGSVAIGGATVSTIRALGRPWMLVEYR